MRGGAGDPCSSSRGSLIENHRNGSWDVQSILCTTGHVWCLWGLLWWPLAGGVCKQSQLCNAHTACVCGTFTCLFWIIFSSLTRGGHLHVPVLCARVTILPFCHCGDSKRSRSGWGKWSAVIQESCSFEGWCCTCIFTSSRGKINSNTFWKRNIPVVQWGLASGLGSRAL